MRRRGQPIVQVANLGAVSVDHPHVQVAVVVPVDQPNGPSIVVQIESRSGRDVGESNGACIQKRTMMFVTAEGPPLPDQFKQPYAIASRTSFGQCANGNGCSAPFVRQDLSPIEASQITRILRGHVAVGDEEIFPTVVV